MTTYHTAEEKLIWAEWKRITRFLESSRISFAREQLIWSSLEIREARNVSLITTEGPSTYKVELEEHLKSLKSQDVLFSVVLGASYALAEAFGRIKLGLSDEDELRGGIESWGKKVLALTGHSWSEVVGGLSGIVEVSAIRNAHAHGVRKVNQKMINRFVAHGLNCPWGLDEPLLMTYVQLEEYRARIKSFMRYGGTARKIAKAVL